MKVSILTVGRLRDESLRQVEAEYKKRLRSFCRLNILELKDDRALAAAIQQGALTVALDERGSQLTSQQFAENILGAARDRGSDVAFLIGGANGHATDVRQRADHLLAFGKMTIAHQLARVLLVEQIYRGSTILAGHPYHK